MPGVISLSHPCGYITPPPWGPLSSFNPCLPRPLPNTRFRIPSCTCSSWHWVVIWAVSPLRFSLWAAYWSIFFSSSCELLYAQFWLLRCICLRYWFDVSFLTLFSGLFDLFLWALFMQLGHPSPLRDQGVCLLEPTRWTIGYLTCGGELSWELFSRVQNHF